jgi:hypothetical protein
MSERSSSGINFERPILNNSDFDRTKYLCRCSLSVGPALRRDDALSSIDLNPMLFN